MIKIDNLTTLFGTKEQRALLNNASLEIPSNKITAIIGPSGIGKTTLLYNIAKIFKPNSGTIQYYDANLHEIQNPKIDLVFQDYNLFENLNVLENIQVGNGVLGLKLSQEILDKQAKLINITPETLKSDVKQLSGGEKQRVALLRALNRQSDFILLDEPTGNLDPNNSKIIFKTLKELSNTKTIVVVSHNYELVKEYADKIVKIQDAKLVIEKDVDNTFNVNNDSNNLKHLEKPSFYNKFWIASKFIKNDLKTKTWQVILIIATFILALFSTLISYNLNIGATRFSQSFVSGNNLDLASIAHKNSSNFNNDEINDLKKDQNVKYVLGATPSSGNFELKYNNNSAISFQYFEVNSDDFFVQRFKSLSEVKGRFIQSKNEIVINEKFAKKLGLLNPLNQTISLQPYLNTNNETISLRDDLKSINYQVKIVGTFTTAEYQNQVDFWVHQDLLKDSNSKIFDVYEKYNKVFSDISKLEGLDSHFGPSASFHPNQTLKDLNVDLIEGKKPSNYNEIIVSSALVNSAKANFDFQLNEKVWARFTPQGSITLKIVGIYDSNELEFRYHNNLIDAYFKNNISTLNVFFKTDLGSDAYNIEYLKNLSNKYSILSGPSTTIFQLLQNSKLTQLITFGLFLVFIILFTSFLISYLKSLSDSKRKSIGILKTLGAKSKWIIFYNSIHVLFILVMTLVIGLIIALPLANIVINAITGFNALEVDLLNNFINFSSSWLYLSIVALIIFAIMSYSQYKKATHKLLK